MRNGDNIIRSVALLTALALHGLIASGLAAEETDSPPPAGPEIGKKIAEFRSHAVSGPRHLCWGCYG